MIHIQVSIIIYSIISDRPKRDLEYACYPATYKYTAIAYSRRFLMNFTNRDDKEKGFFYRMKPFYRCSVNESGLVNHECYIVGVEQYNSQDRMQNLTTRTIY